MSQSGGRLISRILQAEPRELSSMNMCFRVRNGGYCLEGDIKVYKTPLPPMVHPAQPSLTGF